MTGAQAACERVAALVDYPADESYALGIAAIAAELDAAGLSAAAAALAKLRDVIDSRPLTWLQEEYAAAFDFDPDAALELGWHLFGDGPDRGPWLATLAEARARAGVSRSEELPDHLSNLLRLIAHEEELQSGLLAELITPSIQKVHKRLVDRGSPFGALVETAECLVHACAENVRVGRD